MDVDNEAEVKVAWPEIGANVFYILDAGKHAGEARPAVVVRVWSDTCVNLLVFTDGDNDDYGSMPGPVAWQTSVLKDIERQRPRSWYYGYEYAPGK